MCGNKKSVDIGCLGDMKGLNNKLKFFIISEGEIRKQKKGNKIRKGVMNIYICSPLKREKFYIKREKRNKK